jgi:hypothetical protein
MRFILNVAIRRCDSIIAKTAALAELAELDPLTELRLRRQAGPGHRRAKRIRDIDDDIRKSVSVRRRGQTVAQLGFIEFV